MTYKTYLYKKADSILCEFNISSDFTITSTSDFGNTIPIDTISGSSEITLSNNIIILPQGYQFLIKFYTAIERASLGTFIYTELKHSDDSDITNSTMSTITGTSGNASSIEDTTAMIDTLNGNKNIIVKTYKSNASTVTVKKDFTYGYIIGFKK